MILPGAELSIQRIPLERLHVTEHQPRYPQRVMHYVRLLAEQAGDPGLICVKEYGDGYEILDGHHRYCALILAGRPDALCLLIDETKAMA